MKRDYSFQSSVWMYPGMAGWYFLTLPKDTAEDINYYFSDVKRGWGSLPVKVTIKETTWKTSIFPDKESGSFLLPLKAEIRKKESIKEGDKVELSLEIVS